jgi:MurNAc alpha-1-phosphate uridylyltransferase
MQIANRRSAGGFQSAEEGHDLPVAFLRRAFKRDKKRLVTGRPEMNIAPFVWTGVQIVQPTLFEDAPQGRFSINRQWDRSLSSGRLWGVRLDGVWIHVGTPQGLEEAEEFLRDLARSP